LGPKLGVRTFAFLNARPSVQGSTGGVCVCREQLIREEISSVITAYFMQAQGFSLQGLFYSRLAEQLAFYVARGL